MNSNCFEISVYSGYKKLQFFSKQITKVLVKICKLLTWILSDFILYQKCKKIYFFLHYLQLFWISLNSILEKLQFFPKKIMMYLL